jgi:hypothetical protein
MTQAFNLSQLANKVNSSGLLDVATGVTGTQAVANGGTGAATLTANNVLLGAGTSAVTFVAPGSNGNVLTSNGTTWTSAAGSAGGALIGCTVYTSPATWTKATNNPGSIFVQVVGGGGGGDGDNGGPTRTNGSTGGTSSLGSLISATGGSGGNGSDQSAPGEGSGGNFNARGGFNLSTSVRGGESFFQGNALNPGGNPNNAGQPGFANSGGGGSASGFGAPTIKRGGAGGGYAQELILAPALGATEAITVGSGGAAGGGYSPGGNGGAGVVIIWEYK